MVCFAMNINLSLVEQIANVSFVTYQFSIDSNDGSGTNTKYIPSGCSQPFENNNNLLSSDDEKLTSLLTQLLSAV